MYGDEEIGKLKATRGKRHDYLAMNLDYNTPGEVHVEMAYYVKQMIKDFSVDVSKKTPVAQPWNENLFKVNEKSAKLDDKHAEEFHTMVVKGIFLCKQGIPDVKPAIELFAPKLRVQCKKIGRNWSE